jgi:acyl-homoserine-lactone acylase
MTKRQLTVAVKGEASATRTVYATRYGPVIALGGPLAWNATTAYAFADANFANFRSGDAWLGIARARTVEQIRDVAAKTLGIPYVNTIAADRNGHALYADISAIPNLPARKLDQCSLGEGSKPDAETPSLTILDGATAACAWDVDPTTPVPGLMPLKQLPVLIRTDFVANSNDSYWLANPAAPFPALSPILGPHGIRQSLRMRSAIREFAATGKIDAEAARTLTLANKVEAANLVLDDLLKLCPTRPALAPACTALAGWDRLAENDSKGALLFFSWWRRAASIKEVWATAFDPARPVTTPYGLNPAQAAPILDALQAAVDELAKFKVPLDAPLGQYQVAPRNAERIAIHGGPSSAGVLNAMHSAPSLDGLVPFHGTSYVQVVTFDAAGPLADSLLSYSQSSNPESPHFADGTHGYSEKRWLRLPFTPAQIAAQREGEPVRISE